MIVRDAGDAWQVVLQQDHSRLAGQFAAAWGNGSFSRPDPADSVELATARHDEVWCTWERYPRCDVESGKPVNFTEVWVPTHLAFYRGGIAVMLEEDPYAALLLSMHAAGIYRGRYGTEPSLTQTTAAENRAQIEEFVREREEEFGRLAASLGVAEGEQWTNFKLLQVCDRLSLYFAMKDVEQGEAFTIDPAPVDYQGNEVALSIVPDGPWRVRIDPYPFRDPLAVSLPRRLLPKRRWPDVKSFREDFFAADAKPVAIGIAA